MHRAACAREIRSAREDLNYAMTLNGNAVFGDTTDGTLSSTTLKSLILRLVNILNRDMFVVVDALEQCVDRTESSCNLASLLQEMATQGQGRTKVWVSSRDGETDIEAALNPPTSDNNHFLYIHATNESIKGVLGGYLERELDGMAYLNKAQRKETFVWQ